MPTEQPPYITPGLGVGRWTVLHPAPSSNSGARYWICRCRCGTEKSVAQKSLKRGTSLSCGCQRDEFYHSLEKGEPVSVGTRYGRLEVLEEAVRRCGERAWKCRCQCGNITTVAQGSLKDGHTRSCGCLQKESAAETCATRSTHGETRGRKSTKEYTIYHHMIRRCYDTADKAYHLYGGRGISVCERWRRSFHNFLEDMGRCPDGKDSIDRIDNNGDYTTGNVRWANSTEQVRNRRVTRTLTINGETKPLAEWAELTGLKYTTLYVRVFVRGVDPVVAISKPPK